MATGPISDTKPGLIDIKWFEQGVPANPEHRPDIETTLSWLDGHPERLGIIVEQSPIRTQIQRLVDLMNLDPLLAEDLAEGHQRPKLERHGEALFLVLHPPFYIDSIEDVAFVEAEVIKQRNCVVVIMQRIPDELSSLRWTP
ncbi:CorA family divalent cation transporter, partial [Bacillus licheniformis]|nr:CorA family divalent cation transporter [Bacillus licheniformis]